MKLFAAFVSASLAAPAAVLGQGAPDSVIAGAVPFEQHVLADGFEAPWELTLGPDGFLWVTERIGARIVRVDPASGTKTTAFQFDDVAAPGGQDGLLGMALYPGLLESAEGNFIYAAYTYVDRARGPHATVSDEASPYRYLYAKIVRLTYDPGTGQLSDLQPVIEGLPAGSDHNSGRLKFGPDGKLYYTIGDQGNDQLGNYCIPIQSQRLPTPEELAAGDYFAYQGKSLRLNTDGSVPDDNPVIGGVRSHIFTYGHRNMQGIAFAPDGRLYASEQGPKTDDEVNLLLSGTNYGWPHVAGFRDDKAYQYARWKDASVPCEQLSFSDLAIDPSVPREDESVWPGDFREPVTTMFTVHSDWNFSDPACNGVDFICWPTVAASSIETYMPKEGGIPGWENSLLVTALKRGSLYLVPLTEDGQSARGPVQRYFQSENRFRDLAISPDFKTIYVATDPWGLTESLSGGFTDQIQNPGAIIAFTLAETAPAALPVSADGEPAEPQTLARLTGDVPTFTAEQARRGRVVYEANCVSCHGQDLINAVRGTPLAGPYFAEKWIGQSVGALYAHSFERMPPSRPGDLGEQVYADITAYILSVNGAAAGNEALPPDRTVLDRMTIGMTAN